MSKDAWDDIVCERPAQMSKENKMDKYSVDESGTVNQEELEKQAMRGCPKCGGRVERHGRILTCATCGTEPFEEEKA